MSDRLLKKAVFEVHKLLQQSVEISVELEESLTGGDLDNLRKLQKIHAESNEWCKAIIEI